LIVRDPVGIFELVLHIEEPEPADGGKHGYREPQRHESTQTDKRDDADQDPEE
jgi:hypothetical protein